MTFSSHFASSSELTEYEHSLNLSTLVNEGAMVTIPTAIVEEDAISEDVRLRIEDSVNRIDLPELPIDRPWLPEEALRLVERVKKGPVSEKLLLSLMDMVAEEATDYFQFEHGKFVASTLLGRIIEVSDTRVDLLKKIQGRSLAEQIFVWRAGYDSFSGRT